MPGRRKSFAEIGRGTGSVSGEYPAENTGTGWCGCRGVATADGGRDEMLYRFGTIEKVAGGGNGATKEFVGKSACI